MLLGQQPFADVKHERKPALCWSVADETDPLRHIRKPTRGAELYGDVGFYYLPHVRTIWNELPDVRFVCLKRDKAETVASFMRYLPRDMSVLQDGRGQPSSWDVSFPSYPDEWTKEQAFGAYWEAYYALADELAADNPDRFRVFPTEALNTKAGVMDILRFVGVRDPRPTVGLKMCVTQRRTAA